MVDFENEIKNMLDKMQDQTKNFEQKGEFQSVERVKMDREKRENYDIGQIDKAKEIQINQNIQHNN